MATRTGDLSQQSIRTFALTVEINMHAHAYIYVELFDNDHIN